MGKNAHKYISKVKQSVRNTYCAHVAFSNNNKTFSGKKITMNGMTKRIASLCLQKHYFSSFAIGLKS